MSKQMLSLDNRLEGRENEREKKRGCLISYFTNYSFLLPTWIGYNVSHLQTE